MNRYLYPTYQRPEMVLGYDFEIGDKVTFSKAYYEHYPDQEPMYGYITLKKVSTGYLDQYNVQWHNNKGNVENVSFGLSWHLEPYRE